MHVMFHVLTSLYPPVISMIEEYMQWPIVCVPKFIVEWRCRLSCILFMSADRKERQWFDIQKNTIQKEHAYGEPFSFQEFLMCFHYLSSSSSFLEEDVRAILATPIPHPILIEMYGKRCLASMYQDIFEVIGCESEIILAVVKGSEKQIPIAKGHPDSVRLHTDEKDGVFSFWYTGGFITTSPRATQNYNLYS